MYQNNPTDPNVIQPQGERVTEGAYFIVDWICSDPMKRGRGVPTVVIGNANEDEMKKIAQGAIRIENPRNAAKQRVLLKVIKVTDLAE